MDLAANDENKKDLGKAGCDAVVRTLTCHAIACKNYVQTSAEAIATPDCPHSPIPRLYPQKAKSEGILTHIHQNL